MNSTFRSLLFWIVIFAVVVLLWQTIQNGTGETQERTFSDFLAEVEAENVEEVTIKQNELTYRLKGSPQPEGKFDYITQFPDYDDLVPQLI